MLALLDAFSPNPKPEEPELLLKFRVVTGAAFLTILAGLTFWTVQVMLGIENGQAPHLYFLAIGVIVLVLLKSTGAILLCGSIESFGFLSYLTWVGWIDGGVETYILPGFMVMPLTSVLMNGKWLGAMWTLLTIAAIGLLAAVHPDKTLGMPADQHYALLTAAGILATFATGLLAVIIEVSKSSSFDDLKVERSRAEAVAARVGDLLQNLSHSLVKVNHDSTEISDKARHTADSMKEQSQHANTLFDGMETLKQQISENSGRSVKVATDAEQVGERVTETGQVMSRTNKNMSEVAAMLAGAAAKIEELTRRSEEITSIVEVIQSVAEQTNLLALNAAIEAARAGEHGRGFAVVADEVRGLAERTHNSTGEISSQVGSIVSVTQAAMDAMTQATSLMKQGKENADKADEALQSVVVSTNDVAQFLRSLAKDSEQQRDLNEQMTAKFESIRTAIEGAFGATSEIATTIVSLQQELESLSASANSLKD